MDSLISVLSTVAIVAIVIGALKLLMQYFVGSSYEREKIHYRYAAKSYLMTRAESEFFRRLQHIASDKYYVFPQVHLSALLDHKIKGQNFKYAFRHINGKSVDFVLCDIQSLKPIYAVELDDRTHDREDRIERDGEVERIFTEAGLSLVRFRNVAVMSDNQIIDQFANAKKLTISDN